MTRFPIRGFNMCESLLRHTPDELRRFLRRMKSLNFNTVIIHYDYGWKHYHDIICEECRKSGVDITLMTFGPRTFFFLAGCSREHFAKDENGKSFTLKPECETHPCFSDPQALELFCRGAEIWLKQLPSEIRRVHMRAGDGYLFCRCPECRNKTVQDLWQPFVAGFIKAAKKYRPDLQLETDVYYGRYELPQNCSAHEQLDFIMFDPFLRSPLYPLDNSANAPEIHAVLLEHLKQWCKRFPGKVYIHENAMKQGFFGIFQHGTDAALEDLKTFREIGVQGVCFEAYEPGYSAFEEMFETIAPAMNGTVVPSIHDPVADWCRRNNEIQWCSSIEQHPERFLPPGDELEYEKLISRIHSCPIDSKLYREYLDFVMARQEKLDWLYGCFTIARRGRLAGTLKWEGLSPLAQDFSTRTKLWDFLEDLPHHKDALEVGRQIAGELYRCAR